MPLILLHDEERREWLRFENPVETLSTTTVSDVPYLLRQVEARSRYHNRWAAGFVAYEAAPAFDDALRTLPQDNASAIPLAWFGLFDEPIVLERLPDVNDRAFAIGPWLPEIDQTDYESAIRRILDYIRRGDSYQVNFTYRQRAEFAGDPLTFFLELQKRQPGGLGAFIETDDFAIASASPELFFRRDGSLLTTRPMKGTRPRGLDIEGDNTIRAELIASEKDKAENLMIVDMMRNDLNRIAESGSVKVPRLFEIERYPTVWQMTSTVTARSNCSWTDVVGSLFPCSSITGAPKVRTMEIIESLERSPRGIYTGTIGFLSPDGRSQMNVAIRTVSIDKSRCVATYGVGGGIVSDSRPADEYEESRTKAAILQRGAAPRPQLLLETMAYRPGDGVVLIDAHLRRLERSADYFDFAVDTDSIRAALAELTFSDETRIRLTVDEMGAFAIESGPVRRDGRLVTMVSPIRVDSRDPLLYHKTTSRESYDNALAACAGVDDVILMNERAQLTEFTIGNLVIELDRRMLTPPLSSGLLAGTLREELVRSGEIEESVLGIADLRNASAIFRINSVRGWERADVIWD